MCSKSSQMGPDYETYRLLTGDPRAFLDVGREPNPERSFVVGGHVLPAYLRQSNKRGFQPGGRGMSDSRSPPRPASYDKKVGLVLQGGGALGSYQAGVYEALASSP